MTFDLFLAIAKVATQSEVENLLTDPCKKLHLTTEQLLELSKWKTCGKLDKLDVSHNDNLGTAGFGKVALVVSQCHVKVFKAQYCNLTAEGMKVFKENSRNSKLDELDVSYNDNLGTAGFGKVGSVVLQCHVRVFKAQYCNLTAEGMKVFKENSRNAKIHTLDVQNNSMMTFDLFLAIAKVATQSEVKNLLTDPYKSLRPTKQQLMELRKWKICGKLDELDVSHNMDLGNASLGEVGSIVRQCHVTVFKARYCNSTAKGMKAFQANTRNTKIHTLDVRNNPKMTFDLFLAIAKVATQSEVENLLMDPCKRLRLTTEQLLELSKWKTCGKIHTLEVRNKSKITFDLFFAIAKVATQSEVKNLLTDPCEELHLTTEQLLELSDWKTCGKIHTLDVRNDSKMTFDLFLAIAKVATRSEVKNLLTNPRDELRLTTEQLLELSKWKICGKIHTLDVHNNSKMTFDLFLAIAKVATWSEVKHLLTDPFDELHLNTKQLLELSKWKTCGKIYTLNVRNNSKMTFDLFLAIAKVATQSEVEKLLIDPCKSLCLTAEQLMELSKWKICGKLDILDVSGNKDLGTACFVKVGLVLSQCHVKAFKAWECNLTADGMKIFKENTRNTKLDKLDVSGNEDLGTAGLDEVGSIVTQCQVKSFEARFCNLTAEVIKAFKENTRNAKLNELDVTGNENLGTAGFGEVGLVVSQCHVNAFKAQYCNLTAEKIEAFKANTREAKIEFLDLSGNNVTILGGEGLTTISEIVHQCQVKTLRMKYCHFDNDKLERFKALIADSGVEVWANT